MARVPYLSVDDLAEGDRELLSVDHNLFRALVHHPDALRAFRKLGGHIRFRSELDPRLRELAILQVGYSTATEYEYSHHIKLGLEDFGVSEEDVKAIASETAGEESGLGSVEKAVLRGAREMTEELAMSAEVFAELEEALGTRPLFDLIYAVGFYNMVVRMLKTLEIDVEPSYQRYLEQFPLRHR